MTYNTEELPETLPREKFKISLRAKDRSVYRGHFANTVCRGLLGGFVPL